MKDAFGRQVEYLRISVTDKCNLRCVYCMPLEGMPWMRRSELLTYEEIQHVVRVMAGMGLRRVRITGGEPLVRRDLPELVRRIAGVDGIEDLSLSTNAVLLADQAGIRRINVSLDSLRPERVEAIARRPGCFGSIMEGLAAAEDVGFAPIKVNVVLIRGQNDDEIEDFAAVTRERPWHVRFIELMPTASNLELSASRFFSCQEALTRLRAVDRLEPVEGPWGNGPATYYRFPGAAGTVVSNVRKGVGGVMARDDSRYRTCLVDRVQR